MRPVSPFRKREGVPPRDQALAALGMDVEGDKGLKGDRGIKGPEDEIGLSAKEQIEAEKSERVWDRERMIAWAKSLGDDEIYNEAWVDRTFDFLPDGTITSRKERLYLERTNASIIPEGLYVRSVLYLKGTNIHTIPTSLQVEVVDLKDTKVKEIPKSNRHIKKVWASNMQKELIASAKALNIEVETY